MAESFESKWTKLRERQANGAVSRSQLEALTGGQGDGDPIDLVELLGKDWNKPVAPEHRHELSYPAQDEAPEPSGGEWHDVGGAWTRDSQGRLVTPHKRVWVPKK